MIDISESPKMSTVGKRTGNTAGMGPVKSTSFDESHIANKANEQAGPELILNPSSQHELTTTTTTKTKMMAKKVSVSEKQQQQKEQQQIRASKKRYFILLMFVILHVTKSFQWICLASITNVVARFYGVDNLAINWTTILFMVTFLILALPVSWIMDSIGLRRSVLIGTLGVTVGVTIKCFTCHRDGFPLSMLGHLIVGLTEPFFFSSYAQVASVWFPDHQVALATAASLIGEQTGLALGFIIPPLVIGRDPSDFEAIQRGLFGLFLVMAIISIVNTISIVLFFDEEPKFAPGIARYKQKRDEKIRRQSQQLVWLQQMEMELARSKMTGSRRKQSLRRASTVSRVSQSVGEQVKLSAKFMTNKHFILLLIGFGINQGISYSTHTLLNQMIVPPPTMVLVAPSVGPIEQPALDMLVDSLPAGGGGGGKVNSTSAINRVYEESWLRTQLVVEQIDKQQSPPSGGQWSSEGGEANLVVGNAGLILILSGLIGSGLCGVVLDKWHRYKLTTVCIYLLTLVAMAILTGCLLLENATILYLAIIPLGFAQTGYAGCAFDYGVELTYPKPELLSSTLLNMSAQIFGVPISLAGSIIVDTYGSQALGAFFCAALALGFLVTCLQGGELRRQTAVNERCDYKIPQPQVVNGNPNGGDLNSTSTSTPTVISIMQEEQQIRAILAEAGLIRIYHKLKTPLHSQQVSARVNQTDGLLPAASSNTQQPEEDATTSRTSIEISSSPIRKIMDLIGQHAPVIVLDSSGENPTPPSQPQVQTSTLMSPVASGHGTVSTSPGEQSQTSIMIGDLNLPQQQQQHWTILDTSQPQQQQQHRLQQQIQFQQQQQPLAQPQQLFQSTVPNEQYFTFTPFGLAPTSNPFAGQLSQDQSSFLAYQPGEFHAQQQFNAFPSQPQLSQQSSQNQQQTAQQNQQSQNDIQPVFLSSYVPELPSPVGGQQQVSPFAANQNPTAQLQNRFQQQQQQPNSIQQIQQAQQAQQDQTSVRERGGESETEPPSASKKDDGDSDTPLSQSGEPDGDELVDKNQTASESSDDGEPGEKSISYEDKFDSDKDEEPERSSSSVGKSSSSSSTNNQQVAATPPARRTIRDNNDGRGFASVGLNDDCLQCICRASTGCDEMARCITIGAEEKYCGPFWLTEEYWQRAGSPTSEPNSMSPFEDCANDLDCAAQTVTKYMWKYKRDCDGDKLMTCIDYARLHKLKPNECAQSDQMDSKDYQEYWGKFMNCADGYNRTRNADDESFKRA